MALCYFALFRSNIHEHLCETAMVFIVAKYFVDMSIISPCKCCKAFSLGAYKLNLSSKSAIAAKIRNVITVHVYC